MSVVIDTKPLAAEAAHAQDAAQKVRALCWKIVRKVGLDTVTEWKRQQPVDVGRSRASIGQWSDQITQGKYGASSRRNAALANQTDSVYEEAEAELRVTLGSNVEYMEVLNAGHSRQAPAGYIDVIAARAEAVLDAAIAQVTDIL